METKTELMNGSGEASAVSENAKNTEAKKESPARAKKSSNAEKKPQTRRTVRNTARSKSATTEKAIETESERPAEPTPEAETTNAVSDPSVATAPETISAVASEKKETQPKKEKKASAATAKKRTVKKEEKSEETASASEAEKSSRGKRGGKKAAEAESVRPSEIVTENFEEPIIEQIVLPITTEEIVGANDTAANEQTEARTEPDVGTKTTKTKKTASEKNRTQKPSASKKTAAKKTVAQNEAVKKDDTKSEETVTEEAPQNAESTKAPMSDSAIETRLEAMAKKAKRKKAPASSDAAVASLKQEETEMPQTPSESKKEEPYALISSAKEETATPFLGHETEPTETVDVSGTPHDTFFFVSPGQLAQMEAEAAKQAEKTEESAAEAISHVTEDAVTEERGTEKPAIRETEQTVAQTAEETNDKEEALPDVGTTEESEENVVEAKEAATDDTADSDTVAQADAPKAEPLLSEIQKRESVAENANRPDRRSNGQRRGDPHEREVMDKDSARTKLYAVLENARELERRALIEETMRAIPLTDEERRDNHPTSLSNRVRSVIGSVLAEQLSSGKIIAVGRKLTLPSSASKNAEEEIEEFVEHSAVYAESEIKAENETEVEPEIISEPILEPILEPISEPIAEPVFVPAVNATAAETSAPNRAEAPISEVRVAHEEGRFSEESEVSVSGVPVTAESREPVATPVRESSIRRGRTQRAGSSDGRRTQPQSTAGVTAVLITEDELERAMLNAIRRNSATRNDLFAVLKRIYIEPNRLSRDEENRIYNIAGNILQKLVNRGAVQNADGRYLQKPSQRVLNPGRTPDANATGNVEMRFITELNRQSGDFFEQFAARLLEKYFEMSNIRVDASYVVGGSDDNGIDIMLETTDWLGYKERVFVQAKKRATQPVTLKEVREFYGALCAEEGTRGVFITTSNFCMEASKMIGKIRNLIAIDKRKLFALAEHCEVGLVRDEDGRLLLDENLFLDYDV